MSARTTITEVGFESIDVVAPLWETLFDYHRSIGAAGFAIIPRERTWSLRRAHYERVFAGEANPTLWIARRESTAIGYALAFDEFVAGSEGRMLETLSVAPDARGSGLGTRLMAAFDGEVRRRGLVAALDVMSGNDRAKSLYLRHGFEPHSEIWMRSRPAAGKGTEQAPASLSELVGQAGFQLTIVPGPDDTWRSSDRIAVLSASAIEAGSSQLATLDAIDALQRAGYWTIQVVMPASPSGVSFRMSLRAAGFAPCLERMVRR